MYQPLYSIARVLYSGIYIFNFFIMYSYYQKIKAKITALQKLIDSLENTGKFKSIPDLLILKDKYSELKQDFYNEDIEDSKLIEKYNNLEQLEQQII